MTIEFIFSEFREGVSNGFKQLGSYGNKYRLDPTYSSIKKYFPDSKVTLYTDQLHLKDSYPDVNVIPTFVKDSPFDENNPRWGWHCCDYYQVKGMLESKSDVAVGIDRDMIFMSEDVKTIIPLTENFGFCMVINPRAFVKCDGIHTRGQDMDYHIGEDESMGNLLTYNNHFVSLHTKNKNGRKFYETFLEIMGNNPKRGPLQFSRTCWKSKLYPYVLPKQWGLNEPKEFGCGNEIVLLVDGYEAQDYYLESRLD